MTRHLSPIAVVGIAWLLAGCVSDDPRKGGFFGGLAGLGSGAYEKRVADETATLKLEKVRYQEEIDDGSRLDGVVENRRSQAKSMKREIKVLEGEIAGLDAEIEALQHEETVARGDVANAEADVAILLEEIERIEAERAADERAEALGADAGPDADPAEFGEPSPEEISELRAYIIKLQEAVDALKATRARRAAEVAG